MSINSVSPAQSKSVPPTPSWLSRVGFTWLGVYPVLTLIAWVLEPFMGAQSLWMRTLIMSVMMVPLMVLIVMPQVNRFANFLYRRKS